MSRPVVLELCADEDGNHDADHGVRDEMEALA